MNLLCNPNQTLGHFELAHPERQGAHGLIGQPTLRPTSPDAPTVSLCTHLPAGTVLTGPGPLYTPTPSGTSYPGSCAAWVREGMCSKFWKHRTLLSILWGGGGCWEGAGEKGSRAFIPWAGHLAPLTVNTSTVWGQPWPSSSAPEPHPLAPLPPTPPSVLATGNKHRESRVRAARRT